MPPREKRLSKSIDSLKTQIELHFDKLEKEVKDQNFFGARYHIKELDKSLLANLERRMSFLGETDKNLLYIYKKRLNALIKELDST